MKCYYFDARENLMDDDFDDNDGDDNIFGNPAKVLYARIVGIPMNGKRMLVTCRNAP